MLDARKTIAGSELCVCIASVIKRCYIDLILGHTYTCDECGESFEESTQDSLLSEEEKRKIKEEEKLRAELRRKNEKKKKNGGSLSGCLTVLIVAFVIIIFIVALSVGNDSKTSPSTEFVVSK